MLNKNYQRVVVNSSVWVVVAWLGIFQVFAQSPAPVAFPGALGYGRHATGGRGGKVLIVNNLNDDGPGSLRAAVHAKETRIVVFQVAGTIRLETPLVIRGDITIAGQTAPGDGICVADQPVKIDGDNVIIRYMRFRMGDKFQRQAGKSPGSGHDDALSASRKNNILIDHCSISWSTDEVCSIYGGDSTTIQYCLISEPLNYSYHFEEGDTDYEEHGYGGIWGGKNLSAYYNLFAHCVSRTPRFNGTRLGSQMELVDFRNNVIYNWRHNNVYGGEGGMYNIVSNYYKPGPATNNKVKRRIVNPTSNNQVGFGRFYVAGNSVEGFPDVSVKNELGVDTQGGLDTILSSSPFAAYGEPQHNALQALDLVLKYAGASACRDTLDKRIIRDVVVGTGRIIDVQGGFKHGTPFDQTLRAWPLLKQGRAPEDRDEDGMPDSWEKQHGLNPDDPSDAAQFSINPAFTNIEVYINSIVK